MNDLPMGKFKLPKSLELIASTSEDKISVTRLVADNYGLLFRFAC